MKKWFAASALSIGVLTSGFSIQAQATETIIAPKVLSNEAYAAVVAKEVSNISYQDLYKLFKIAELDTEGLKTTMDTKKGHFIVKMPITALIESDEEDSTTYKAEYAEYEKLFGKTMQLKFTPSGSSFNCEIYTEGQWVKLDEDEKEEFIAEIVGDDDFELRAGGNFKDTIGHWSESYIQVLYQAEIIGGTTETTFNPNGKITRGQLVAMIFRSADFDDESNTSSASYTDIANFWGAKEVAILENYGLLTIFEGNQFQPNKAVTREEMAYIIAQYLKLEGLETDALKATNTFKDVQKMNPEAVNSIGILHQLGIISGENGNFDPKGELTRAQFAKIFTLSLFALD